MTAPFSWDDLRLLLAVAEERGLGPAAERLGLNGSTVFRRLGALETRLGLKLFERHRTGYVPTASGADAVALAARMDADVTALGLRLAGRAPSPSGEVRVTTNDTLLVALLTPLFARFRQAHPGVTLDVVLSNEALNLSRRDADVAVRASEAPPETLVGRRVASIAWALYGLVRDGPLAEDGEDRNWVVPGGTLSGIAPARRLAVQAPPGRIAYRVDSILGLTAAIEAGIGIGALPCFVGDRHPDLLRLAPPDPAMANSLWLLTHPELRTAPRIRALLDFLADAIASERTALEGEAGPSSA